jgi:hypothetical protein
MAKLVYYSVARNLNRHHYIAMTKCASLMKYSICLSNSWYLIAFLWGHKAGSIKLFLGIMLCCDFLPVRLVILKDRQ